ncbi:hypothetical protein GCM10023082_36870 [Streptomyces tremellae]|uniref:DUF4232 domain-containing protein n=2 Tax=Streptomyces tremellae TaxID=1124239 RepID=A0ABP7FCM9_9ACTN
MRKMRNTRRTGRTAAAAAAGALLLAGTAAATASATPGAAPAGPRTPTCRTADLSAKLMQPLAGGMNHAGSTLQLTNTSHRTCALRGYPGLGLEGPGHRALPTRTEWGPTWYADTPAVRTLILPPGRRAQSVLSWTHTDSADTAAYLEITPPAATTHLTVPFNQRVDGGVLQVTALSIDVPLRG